MLDTTMKLRWRSWIAMAFIEKVEGRWHWNKYQCESGLYIFVPCSDDKNREYDKTDFNDGEWVQYFPWKGEMLTALEELRINIERKHNALLYDLQSMVLRIERISQD